MDSFPGPKQATRESVKREERLRFGGDREQVVASRARPPPDAERVEKSGSATLEMRDSTPSETPTSGSLVIADRSLAFYRFTHGHWAFPSVLCIKWAKSIGVLRQ